MKRWAMKDRCLIRKFLRDPGPTPPPGWTIDNPYIDGRTVPCRYRAASSQEELEAGGTNLRQQAEVEFSPEEFGNIGRDDRLRVTTRLWTREFGVDGEPQLPDTVLMVRVK